MADLLSSCRAFKHYSNDHAWLDAFLTSRSVVDPQDPVSLIFILADESKPTNTLRTQTVAMDNEGRSYLDRLLNTNNSNLRAIVLCHTESCEVDAGTLVFLTDVLGLNHSFVRQHFDYANFHKESDCPPGLRVSLRAEKDICETFHEYTRRWKPVRLPSEGRDRGLKMGIDDDCMSFCTSKGIGQLSQLLDIYMHL